MVDIYTTQRDSGALNRNLEQVFSGGWNPFEPRDEAASTWDKRDKSKDQTVGPEICWNHQLNEDPLTLLGMTDEEKEVSLDPSFLTSRPIIYTIAGIYNFCELAFETTTGHDKGR
jgi:hypothetical protein